MRNLIKKMILKRMCQNYEFLVWIIVIFFQSIFRFFCAAHILKSPQVLRIVYNDTFCLRPRKHRLNVLIVIRF